MKKNFLYSVMALFMVLLASCSQEEIISENNGNGKVTISVGVPGGAATRAGMPEVDGVIRRCIMQVVDENGVAIAGDEMKQTTTVNGDKVTFSFTEPEREYSVVFWADYVKNIDKDECYNTTTLPNVTLAHNRNTMFTAAGDAFCGKIAKGESTNVILKRPFNKIVVGSTNTTVFSEYTEIQIAEFPVTDGYNILDKTCSSSKNIKLDRTAMNNAASGEWTSFFVFAPNNQTAIKLNLPIMLYKKEDATNTPSAKFTASTSAPTDENVIGNMDIPNIPAEKIEVEITFDDKFKNEEGGTTEPEDPETPAELAVGSYINAAGEVVTDATDAIAVVFAMANDITNNDDVASAYGESYAAKSIKAYAVSLKNVTSRENWTSAEGEAVTELTATTTKYQGYTATEALLGLCKDFTGGMFKTFETWRNNNQTNNANLSQWYIPSFSQLTLLTNLVFGNANDAADADFIKIVKPQSFFTNPNSDVPAGTSGWYLTSSTINGSNKISTYTVGNGNTTTDDAAFTCISGSAELIYNTKGFVRPVLTIFE